MIKTIVAAVLGAALTLPALAACTDSCDGNVTEVGLNIDGQVILKIHDGAGDDFCTVTRDAEDVTGCQVGNLYPKCAT